MTSLNQSHRVWGVLVILGGALLVIGIALHPPIADPWDVSSGLRDVSLSEHWKEVHLVMSLGLIMWLIGLAGCSCMFQKNFHILRVCVSLFIASLAKWLLIASTEIGAIPALLGKLADHEEYGLRSLGEIIFTSTLIGSYTALLLTWLSVTLLASYLSETKRTIFLPVWGFWTGWLGIAGIVAILLLHVDAGAVAMATSLPPFLWTLLYGWQFAFKHSSIT